MIVARGYLCLVLALAIGTAVPTFAHAQPTTFVSLPQFLTLVSAAQYTDHVGASQFAVESEAEFEVMRAHLLSQYEGVTATHSFLIDTQYVDCIPILQQPTARKLGLTALPTPPPPPAVNAPAPPGVRVKPMLSLGLSDSFGNAISCDDGTIPMRRVTLEDLSRFPTFLAFLAKAPPPPTSPSGQCLAEYRYAVGQNGAQPPFYGAQTTLDIWYPAINPNYGSLQHSLSQMWVEGVSATKPLQTAEAGWTVDPNRTGTAAATLFVYWTANGYVGSGCYDLDCSPGFVQTSKSWVLGAANWPGPSVAGNPYEQVFIGPLQWTLSGGNWWLCDGFGSETQSCNIGYYPGTIYAGGQMSLSANALLFGGEVSSPKPPGFSPMGSGYLASAGGLYAAYQWNTSYLNSAGTFVPTNLTEPMCSSNSSCFTLACANSNCSSFYFGGPGGASCP